MFLVREHWKKLNRTVFGLLEKRRSAPVDMYIELLRSARRKLGIQVDVAADEALQNPELAREQFFDLPEPDRETACISLLEEFHSTLSQFMTNVAEAYVQELREFVEDHNLRYSLSNDCKFQLSIQGMMVSEYAKLRKAVSADPTIQQSFEELESSISKLSEPHEERSCIRIATNVLEGIACTKTTNGQTTLGGAIQGCNVFPHNALMQIVREFYRFSSDYPNIRHSHPETPANKLRELKKDDALLAVSLAMAFGLYVYDNDSTQSIISGDL
jgi:hypothetical protein